MIDDNYKPTSVVCQYDEDGVNYVLHTEMPWGADGEMWATWFRRLLLLLGFYPDTIQSICPDEEEADEDDEEDGEEWDVEPIDDDSSTQEDETQEGEDEGADKD